MPRPLRRHLPDGPFHVMSHAVDGALLFHRDADRRRYLGLLQVVVERRDWTVLALVLMDNHIHLLVETKVEDLSAGCWWLNWQYAEHYKAGRPDHMGHVFSGRPRVKPIKDDRYLMAVIRYIARNPTRPDRYRWSSHRAITGDAPPLPIIARDRVLELFGPTRAIDRYREFVDGRDPANHHAISAWAVRPDPDRLPIEALIGDGGPAALQAAHEAGHSLRAICGATGLSYRGVRERVTGSRGLAP